MGTRDHYKLKKQQQQIRYREITPDREVFHHDSSNDMIDD